jgi:hypothetical protein
MWTVEQFLQGRIVTPNTKVNDLFEEYLKYCEEKGIGVYSKQVFYTSLRALGYKLDYLKRGGQLRAYIMFVPNAYVE